MNPPVGSATGSPVTLAEGAARLQAAGFRVTINDGLTSSRYPAGSVTGQDTPSDTAAPRGAVVTIAVVGRAAAIAVPEIEGLSLREAAAELERAGLSSKAQRRSGEQSAETDEVIDADIGVGKLVPEGTVIRLTTRRVAQ